MIFRSSRIVPAPLYLSLLFCGVALGESKASSPNAARTELADRLPQSSASCPGGSDELIQATLRVVQEYGDEWATYATKSANATTINATGRALRVLADADSAVVARIKTLSNTDQERLVTALAQCDGKLVSEVVTSKKRHQWRAGRLTQLQVSQLLTVEIIDRIAIAQRLAPALGDTFVDTLADIGTLAAKGADGLGKTVSRLLRVHSNNTNSMRNFVGIMNELLQSARLARDATTASLVLGRKVTRTLAPSTTGKAYAMSEIDAVRTLTDGRKLAYEFKVMTSPTAKRSIRKKEKDGLRTRAAWADSQGIGFLLFHRENGALTTANKQVLETTTVGQCKVRGIDDVTDIPSS